MKSLLLENSAGALASLSQFFASAHVKSLLLENSAGALASPSKIFESPHLKSLLLELSAEMVDDVSQIMRACACALAWLSWAGMSFVEGSVSPLISSATLGETSPAQAGDKAESQPGFRTFAELSGSRQCLSPILTIDSRPEWLPDSLALIRGSVRHIFNSWRWRLQRQEPNLFCDGRRSKVRTPRSFGHLGVLLLGIRPKAEQFGPNCAPAENAKSENAGISAHIAVHRWRRRIAIYRSAGIMPAGHIFVTQPVRAARLEIIFCCLNRSVFAAQSKLTVISRLRPTLN
jgi:hypothetical protein